MRMSTAFVCFVLCVFFSSFVREVIAQPATPGVSLKAKPTLIKKIEDITVSWSNVLQPSPEDFIELFYANYNSSIARAQKQASGESSGFVVFQDLVNSRLDYQFRYVSKIAGVVVVSDLVRVDVNYPVQAHLSLTHDFTKMRLMWVSGTKEEPVVVYGVKSGNFSERVYATTHTYTVQDFLRYENGSITKAVDNFIPPGYIHDAILTHIRPNEKYYYVFGSEDGFSEEFTFTGPPKPGTQTEVKFIMVADSGTGVCAGMHGWCEEASLNTTTLALDDIDKDGYNFVLHVGDISYAVGDAWRWDQFFTQIEPLAATVPYMVTIGNHEYDYTNQPFLPKWADFLHDSYGEAGVVYNNKFHMPGPNPTVVSSQNNNYDSNNNDNLWYSFEYGGAHFTVLSNEHDFLPGSEQYNWLVKDLGSVDRERTPFLIVAAHRPMYCSAQMFFDNIFSTHIQEALDDLLYQHKVDVYLGGHFHLYERTCKMYQYKCVSDGVMHIVAGMGGQDLELTWQKPQPDWSLFRGDEYGYTRFHITNSTALHVQYVLNSNHTVADDFWLYKQS